MSGIFQLENNNNITSIGILFIIIIPFTIMVIKIGRRLINQLQYLNTGRRYPKARIPAKNPNILYPYGIIEFQGGRAYQEDRNIVQNVNPVKDTTTGSSSSSSIYAVFDGHGGESAAQFCTTELPKEVINAPFDFITEPEKCLDFAFKATDKRYLEAVKLNPAYRAGTTALVMLCNGNDLYFANTGDSRAIMVHSDGSVTPMSDDQKPDRFDERERITRLGGVVIFWGVWRVEGVLAVSRAIGDPQLKKFVIPDPEVKKIKRTAKEHFAVLATDGLWDVLSNEECATIVSQCDDSQVAAQKLCEESAKRGTTDNVTIIVVDVRKSSLIK